MGYLHIAAVTPLRPYLFYLSSAVLFFGSFFASRTMLYTYSVIHCSEYPVTFFVLADCHGCFVHIVFFQTALVQTSCTVFSVILRNAPLKIEGMRNFHCIRLPISIIRSLENP